MAEKDQPGSSSQAESQAPGPDTTGGENRENQDTGLSAVAAPRSMRMLNPDGTFNVRRVGQSRFDRFSFYHHLIEIRWRKFHLYVLFFYFFINVLFSLAYMAVGVEQLNGGKSASFTEAFLTAFFFSAQTITTVGYGHISPSGLSASGLAAFESLLGLMFFALVTGVLYGRFSRPTARFVISNKSVIAPYRGITGWMFRFANRRTNQLIDMQVEVILARNEVHEGKVARKFYSLELERSKVSFFPTTWTVVHPIDESSPMWHLDAPQFEEGDPEFMIIIRGYDDTFSQSVHTRMSYKAHEVLWGHKFVNVHEFNDGEAAVVRYDKLSETESVIHAETAQNSGKS